MPEPLPPTEDDALLQRLEQLAAQPDAVQAMPEAARRRLMEACGRVANGDKQAARQRKRAARSQAAQERHAREQEALRTAAIRRARFIRCLDSFVGLPPSAATTAP